MRCSAPDHGGEGDLSGRRLQLAAGTSDALPLRGGYPGDRQFVAVFNTNRCIACQTCTMACKSTWTFYEGQEHMWWTNVETKPYGGYPHNWDMKTLGLIEHGETGRGTAWIDGAGPESPTAVPGRHGVRGRCGHRAAGAWVIYPTTMNGRRRTVTRIPLPRFALLWGVAAGTPHVVLLPAADLQPLRLSRLPRGLPAQGHLQAARGWNRPH